MELKTDLKVASIVGKNAALMLSYIKTLNADIHKNIFVEEGDVFSNTGIKKSTQAYSLKKLLKFGYLSKVSRKGFPAKRYVILADPTYVQVVGRGQRQIHDLKRK